MRNPLPRFLWTIAFLLLLAAPGAAQEFRGRLTGTVTDKSAAVLPGVMVTARSPALIQPQTAVTGADGAYRFPALPPGRPPRCAIIRCGWSWVWQASRCSAPHVTRLPMLCATTSIGRFG